MGTRQGDLQKLRNMHGEGVVGLAHPIVLIVNLIGATKLKVGGVANIKAVQGR